MSARTYELFGMHLLLTQVHPEESAPQMMKGPKNSEASSQSTAKMKLCKQLKTRDGSGKFKSPMHDPESLHEHQTQPAC